MTYKAFLDQVLDRLEDRRKQAGLTPRALSLSAGISENSYATLLRHRRSPNLETLFKLCETLGESPASILDMGTGQRDVGPYASDQLIRTVLSAVTDQAMQMLPGETARPRIRDLLKWWDITAGRLINYERFQPFIDLYEPPQPDTMTPRPIHIGAQSLAGLTLKSTDVAILNERLAQAGPALCRHISTRHQNVLDGAPIITVETLTLGLPHNFNVDIKYTCLLLPVSDPARGPMVLNYSQLIR